MLCWMSSPVAKGTASYQVGILVPPLCLNVLGKVICPLGASSIAKQAYNKDLDCEVLKR